MSPAFNYFDNQGGLNQQAPPLALDESQCAWVENLHLSEAGQWTTQNIGYSRLNTASLNGSSSSGQAVRSLHRFETTTGTVLNLAQAGGSLYSLNTGTGVSTLVSTGWSSTAPLRSVTWLGWLFLVAQGQSPYRYNAQAAPSVLPGWPPTIAGQSVGNPSLVEVFAGRLVFAGDSSNPSALYLSALEDPTSWSPGPNPDSPGVFQVSPGDGDKITALKRLFLPLSNEELLVVFKKRSIWLLSGSDATNFKLERASSQLGAVSQESTVSVGQELLFLSEQGIYSLNTATQQGNLTFSALSAPIVRQVGQLNRSALGGAVAFYAKQARQVWWAVPEGSSSTNNRIWVLQLQGPNTASWTLRNGFSVCSILETDGLLLTGSYDGYVLQQLKGLSYNGATCNWRYDTPVYALEGANLRKRLRHVELLCSEVTSAAFGLACSWDLDPQTPETLTPRLAIKTGEATSTYGQALFGAGIYAASGKALARISPPGSGRLVQLQFTGTLPQQPVTLEGWTIVSNTGGTL